MVRDYFTQGHFEKYEPTNAFGPPLRVGSNRLDFFFFFFGLLDRRLGR